MRRALAPSLLLVLSFLGCRAPREARAEPRDAAPPWSAPPLARALSVRDGRTGSDVELEQLLDRLARADVVFLGETHVDETTHRFELAVYQGLLERRGGRVVLALEMFERDVQPALDGYLAGSIDEATFLARARPWSNYSTAYRPLIEWAKEHGRPVVASNFPTPLRQRMASEGEDVLARLEGDERRQAPERLLADTPAYWRRVDNAIRGHLGMMGPPPAPDDPRLTDTQSLWDNCMGESCARALAEHEGWLVLHVNGGFHSEYWDGTARQLSLRAPAAKVLTVAIDPSPHPAVEELSGIARADFVVFAEARAQDVQDGELRVEIARELAYRLHVPASASAAARVPLLIWLGDDGVSAQEELAEWKERIGDRCAIVAIEAPYRETQDDLVEAGRWYWPDRFDEDVATLVEGVERVWGFVLRHEPVDDARVCLAGEGTGATVATAIALLGGRMGASTVALAPRRFAKIKDFPLPLPELAGEGPKPRKSLRLVARADDRAWWSSELEQYRSIGLASELTEVESDPWRADDARENEIRNALGLEARVPAEGAPRRFVLAAGPRARGWARRIAAQHARRTGELVAVLAAPPSDAAVEELPTRVRARDFASDRALPRCPGPFGGTTVVALPAELAPEEIEAWLAVERDDPLAKKSRFLRTRVATASGERALGAVLARLLEEGRKNVLVVPAVFCADGARMRELQSSVAELDDRMTLNWLPGLGSPGAE